MSTPPSIFAAPGSEAPVHAVLFGADYSGSSITPSRGFLAPDAVRHALGRFAPWQAERRIDLAGSVLDLGDAMAAAQGSPEVWDTLEAHAGRAWAHARELPGAPLIIGLGGDHSVTWPLVEACARTPANEGNRIGIVQLDVHHDVRDPSPHRTNGSPIRGLLEAGVVRGSDVVQLGIHPFGNGRALTEWCDAHGIHRWSLAQIGQDGIGACVSAGLGRLADCDLIYLTVDIDVLDRSYAPGTVAALPGGIAPAQLMAAVELVCADPRTRAIDVVEFDPARDVSQMTALNAAHVVMGAIAATAGR